MNMKKLITITAMATTILAIGAGTFESIPFNLPTYSEEDPLGAKAITNVTQTIVVIQENVTTASNAAAAAQTAAESAQTTATTANNKATALETTIAETVQKGQLTNDVVIVGNAKGANGAGMESTTTSIVFAVNRDIDELDAANGEILFAADKVRFSTGIGAIWFGDQTLDSILGNAGQGEMNVITAITTNGVATTVTDKTVDIVIPAPGDANVIEGITTNGVATTITDKTVNIVIPEPGEANVITAITTNGQPTEVNGKTVNIEIPSLPTDLLKWKDNAVSGANNYLAFGNNNTAGQMTFTFGNWNSDGYGSFVFGNSNNTAHATFVYGSYNQIGNSSIAFGESNVVGQSSTVIGGYGNTVGDTSLVWGPYNNVGNLSMVFGTGNLANQDGAVVIGYTAAGTNQAAFVWNPIANTLPVPNYGSHGIGSFNVNPAGGAYGFYIGDQNLATIVGGAITDNAASKTHTHTYANITDLNDYKNPTISAAAV